MTMWEARNDTKENLLRVVRHKGDARGFILAHNLPIEVPKMRLKPVADLFIDDRNLDCKEINWKEIIQKIEEKTCTM